MSRLAKRFLCTLLAGLLLISAAWAGDGRPLPLRLGIHPYASTLTLISANKPLQQYLSQQLGQPVEFYTAPNFEAFVDTMLSGGYDIAISPPHFAVLAAQERYVPLVRYRSELEPVLAVRRDTRFTKAEDFRGTRIAMADASALIRLAAIRWLEDHGLKAGVDFQIVERPTHGAAVAAALMDEADAGVVTAQALKLLPQDVQDKVRAIGTGERLPHLFTLVNRKLGPVRIARIRSSLLAFPATIEGQQFMAKSGFQGYAEISEADLRALKPYVELYQRLNPVPHPVR